ncbi:MAG: DUF1207 domain-containing protein [Planctomycetia bacterium]|jgi:hypothetical protein|nr:DUF1207 domain-containing protein [Planctomycetia bacterium]
MPHRFLPLLIASLMPLAAWPAAGQIGVEPPTAYELPPTRPQGPVVLDVPYEEMPGGAEDELVPGAGFPEEFVDLWAPRPWSWQIMPNNLIYTSYLAGPKEPRLATVWYDDTAPDPFDPAIKNGWMWDMTAGARVSLLRYGSDPVLHPQGIELQVEGAAFVRLDQQDELDLRSSDYRFGIPLVFGIGRWQTKLAYYHLSAHLGDESMLKHQSFPRVNYLRDAMVWGNSYYLLDWMRIYGEVGYSFHNSGGSEPWEFQAGVELVQARPTGPRGAPFFAINGMSRQELNWGGNVCVQTGWAWRGRRSERLLRVGFEYLNGSDPQYEFVFYNQNRCGIGMWYDF